jgi:hypothetical protein
MVSAFTLLPPIIHPVAAGEVSEAKIPLFAPATLIVLL